MAPLDRVHIILNDAYGVGGFMARVHPNEDVRAAATEAEEVQQKWLANLALNRDLYESVQTYASTDDAAQLSDERQRNLEFWLRDFRRARHELDSDARRELQDLKARLIEIQVEADQNIDSWGDGLDLTRADLAGLPDAYIDRLAPGAKEATFHVSVAYPDYIPFIEQATNRELRQRMQFKFMNRAAE